MSTRIFSSRDFTRDVAAAKAAALTGPVLITDRGLPSFVMLNIDEYHRLQGKSPSLFALMQQLSELPEDVSDIPGMDVDFRDVELWVRMIVLDTNVISELRKKPHNQDPKVCAWSQAQPASASI
jgi:hypothetical protein